MLIFSKAFDKLWDAVFSPIEEEINSLEEKTVDRLHKIIDICDVRISKAEEHVDVSMRAMEARLDEATKRLDKSIASLENGLKTLRSTGRKKTS